MLKFSEIFEFSRENSYFERIRMVRLVRMVRMVRSLADRTFQLRSPGEEQELLALVIAHQTDLRRAGAELTSEHQTLLRQVLASRIAFLTEKGHTRTPTENEQLLAAIRVRIEEIEIARTNKNTTGLTQDQRAELAGINSTKDDLQVRTPVNNIEYFPPNFEGLVLGGIDADFCK